MPWPFSNWRVVLERAVRTRAGDAAPAAVEMVLAAFWRVVLAKPGVSDRAFLPLLLVGLAETLRGDEVVHRLGWVSRGLTGGDQELVALTSARLVRVHRETGTFCPAVRAHELSEVRTLREERKSIGRKAIVIETPLQGTETLTFYMADQASWVDVFNDLRHQRS